ncbi:MAG: hypothetical protein R3F60_21775 [bacterium]
MNPHRPSRSRLARSLLTFALAAGSLTVTLTGCEPVGDEGFDAGTVNIPLEGTCVDGCTLLEECGQCDTDDVGQCYDRVQCIEECDLGQGQARFACLLSTGAGNACGADFDGCLTGASVDGCHAACAALEICESCKLDEGGRCLSTLACVQRCESTPAEAGAFQCVIDLQACDQQAIDDCFGAAGRPDPGDDDCGRGCAALDDCQLCLPDDNEECLDILACAAACRGADDSLDAARAACIAGVQACDGDAINACPGGRAPVGDDDCAKGCAALDACDLCYPDDAGECLSVAACADACRGGTGLAPEAAICVENVAECDAAAIDVCFGIEPIGDACALACTQLDECEFCLTDGRASAWRRPTVRPVPRGPDQRGGCHLPGRGGGCEAPIDACLNAEEPPPPPAPDCATYCQRTVECAELPAEEQEAALTACQEQCAANDDPTLRTCYVEAADCTAAAACTPTRAGSDPGNP